MTQPSGTPKFEIRYEEGGELPVYVDQLKADTIENGIYLTVSTLVPQKGDGTQPREASVQATHFLPVSAIEALHTLTTGVRQHFGDMQNLHNAVGAAPRYDKPRSDVPVLADFFNCNPTPGGVLLGVGRVPTSTPNLGVVYVTYHMSIRTILQLHWLIENLVMLIQRPDGVGGSTQTRQ